MLVITELYENEVELVDTDEPNIHYFFNVSNPDRKKVDESFGHAFGIEVRYSVEYSFTLDFKEAMDDNGDLVVVDKNLISVLKDVGEGLLSSENPELLNKIYF